MSRVHGSFPLLLPKAEAEVRVHNGEEEKITPIIKPYSPSLCQYKMPVSTQIAHTSLMAAG